MYLFVSGQNAPTKRLSGTLKTSNTATKTNKNVTDNILGVFVISISSALDFSIIQDKTLQWYFTALSTLQLRTRSFDFIGNERKIKSG